MRETEREKEKERKRERERSFLLLVPVPVLFIAVTMVTNARRKTKTIKDLPPLQVIPFTCLVVIDRQRPHTQCKLCGARPGGNISPFMKRKK